MRSALPPLSHLLAAPPCNLCGSTRRTPMFEKFGHAVVRCADCSLQCMAAVPTAEEVAAYYDEGYYQGDPERRGYLDYTGSREVMVRGFAEKLAQIESMLPTGSLPRSRRVLDVGSAAGWFLQAAEARGWDAVGVEVSDWAWREAVRHGLRVIHGASLEPFAGQQFDLVTMFDVLEHLRDPLGDLRKARSLLADDGWLVFTTGDVDNIWSRLEGRHNRIYNPPQHLFYFSRRTMVALAERAGLEVVRVEPDCKTTTLHYVLHIARNLVDVRPLAWLLGAVMKVVPDRTVRLRLVDNLVVYCRRPRAAVRAPATGPDLEPLQPESTRA